MNHDYLTIRAEMHVELDCISALGDSELHRFERVLGPARAAAAMRYHRSGARIKQDVHMASPFFAVSDAPGAGSADGASLPVGIGES